MFKKVKVNFNEKAILIIDGKLEKILEPGNHIFFSLFKKIEIYKSKIDDLNVAWENINSLLTLQKDEAKKIFNIVESNAGEITLIWQQFQNLKILYPDEISAFWKIKDNNLQIFRLGINDYFLPKELEIKLLNQEISTPLQKYSLSGKEKIILTDFKNTFAILNQGEFIINHFNPQLKALHFYENFIINNEDLYLIEKINPKFINDNFLVLSAGENEIILLEENGLLNSWILPNHRVYFFKSESKNLQIYKVNLQESLLIDTKIITKLKALSFAPNWLDIISEINVPNNHKGYVYIDEKMHNEHDSGSYFYWNIKQNIYAEIIDLRKQSCEILGQEIISADKITLRINAVCNYQIIDSLEWLNSHQNPAEFLYREFQFAVRTLIANKTVDALLNEKSQIHQELQNLMTEKALPGVKINSCGLKDVILPGEIRTILLQVVEAEKQAQANNIKRREETAATRSLLNTARVMEDNPTALRLKELETLEKISEKVEKISVVGGLDSILKDLVTIQNKDKK